MAARLMLRGFTLVEITVVLVVIGLVAAIAIPRFVGGDAFSSRGFFDQSQGIVRYAQKVAVAQRRTVFVVVSAGEIAVCYDAGCASRVASPVDSVDPLGAHTTAPTGVTLSTSNFSFNGLGQPSSGVVITFTSSVADDPARTITVTSETGYVVGNP